MNEYQYAYSAFVGLVSPYTKPSSDRLVSEIRASAIVTVLDHVDLNDGSQLCSLWFKADLSAGDKTILDGVVAAHSGEPLAQKLPIQPIKQIDTSSLDPDQAHTRLRGYSFEALGKEIGTDGKWTEFSFSLPYTIDLLMGEGPAPAEGQKGDEFEFYVDPDRVIGALTADALAGAESVSVSSTVLANIKPGFLVAFGPGGDLHEVGFVNVENGTISFTPALEGDKIAGTYVLRTICYCETIHITPGEALSLGGQTAGSTPVPVGVGMRVRYWNTNTTPVTVQFRLIYKY